MCISFHFLSLVWICKDKFTWANVRLFLLFFTGTVTDTGCEIIGDLTIISTSGHNLRLIRGNFTQTEAHYDKIVPYKFIW
jgi:hypothetical protein